MPFNRAEKSWVYRAAKGDNTTMVFGSTRDLRPTATILFANCLFPVLSGDATLVQNITIGPHCNALYETSALSHNSGMSYGTISKPAVLALSKGAKLAGCWLNTGGGGLSPYHLQGGADLIFPNIS